MKKRFGIVSYNIYGNFTNYGSALQTYALHRVVNELDPLHIGSIVIDYCPDALCDKDILDPVKNMWDKDAGSQRSCELSLPAIRINSEKFDRFYQERYVLSRGKYTSSNFCDSLKNEGLDGYICGSDTIWNISELGGFDDGYFADYPVMKNSHTIAYAASFGDAVFSENDLDTLKAKLKNYKAIGVRENTYLDLIKSATDIDVQQVLDPTLLLTAQDYVDMTAQRQLDGPYVLLYVRRYNKKMEIFADKIAKERNCKVIEISLCATNADRHIMRYDAGVEEFLSLIKHAEYVVTNSYHGMIFSIQMHKEFSVFSREHCETKIEGLLRSLGLSDRKLLTGEETRLEPIDYEMVEKRLAAQRSESIDYLKNALMMSPDDQDEKLSIYSL